MDYEKTKQLLKSPLYEEQINALNSIIDLVTIVSDDLIECLETTTDKLFIAEKIYLIEGLLSNKLIKYFETSKNKELKLHIALILLKQDNISSKIKDFLIDVFKNEDWELAEAALFKLRQVGAKDVIPDVIKKLEVIDFVNTNKLEALIEALNHFKIELPKRITDLLDRETGRSREESPHRKQLD